MESVVRVVVIAVAAIAGTAVFASCIGPPTAPYVDFEETGAALSGIIKFKNQPLQVAMVVVEGVNGGGNTGNVDENGRYTVARVPVGEVRIGVNTAAAVARARGEAMGGAVVNKDAKGLKKNPPRIVEVPGNYQDPKKSGFTTKIEYGDNVYDINIE